MSVAVMRFRAGNNSYAIAAGCIESIGPVQADVVHLTWLLNRELPQPMEGGRTLQILAGHERVDFTVDGPVELVELEPSDIAPCRTVSSTILGFARGDSELYALLDADGIAELSRRSGRTVVNEARDV